MNTTAATTPARSRARPALTGVSRFGTVEAAGHAGSETEEGF